MMACRRSIQEDPMVAKKKRVREKEQENVAAALDSLDNSAAAIAKASTVVKRRIEELDETITELENRLQEMEKESEKALRNLQDKYLKDTTTLQTRLGACEEKLRKVQQTLT
jgi:prefoldin subunit 5